jgi:hypothetical protein
MIIRVGTRLKLEMAERVRVFVEAHPADDPSLSPLVAALTGLLERSTQLIAKHDDHRTTASAATAQRLDLRRYVTSGLLRLIGRTGQAASREAPALRGRFQTVRLSGPSLVFVRSSEALLAAAREHGAVLNQQGLNLAVIDEAETMLRRYQELGEEESAARQGRIETRVELESIARDNTDVVKQLDALTRHRFARDPEVLAAWKTARNIVGPARRQAVPEEPSAPAAGAGDTVVTPPAGGSGDVAPAA